MLSRILFGIILIVSAFVFQWWISLILAVAGLFYFDHLYEVVFAGIIIDSLYGKNFELPIIDKFDFPITLLLILILIIIYKFKQNLLISR